MDDHKTLAAGDSGSIKSIYVIPVPNNEPRGPHCGSVCCCLLVADSFTDLTDSWLTLIKHDINNCLNFAGSADTNTIIGRNTNKTESLLCASQSNDTTDGLTDTNVIHVTHEDDCFQSINIDTLGQKWSGESQQTFVRITTPSVQRVEELLTIDFLSVNDCTSLGCDCHPGISTLIQLNAEIRVRNKTHDLCGATSTNQSLVDVVVIDSLQQVVSILSIRTTRPFTIGSCLTTTLGGRM